MKSTTNNIITDIDTKVTVCRSTVGCKDCCSGQSYILKPSELYAIANKLNISMTETAVKYTTPETTMPYNIPVLILKTIGNKDRCIFLDTHNGCKLNDAKPTVCKLNPISRNIYIENKEQITIDNLADISDMKVQYMANVPLSLCTMGMPEYTIREWLDIHNIPIEDMDNVIFLRGMSLLATSDIYIDIIRGPNRSLAYSLSADILKLLYTEYDTKSPLTPQILSNMRQIMELLNDVNKAIKIHKI